MKAKKLSRRNIAIIITACLVAAVIIVSLCLYFFYFKYTTDGGNYGIVQIDLSVKPTDTDAHLDYLYNFQTIDFGDGGESYMAHPDSVLLNRGTDDETVLTAYVSGHGRGALICKTTKDGETYSARLTNTPESWKHSEETPTLYELDFTDGSKKLIMISANPKWPGYTSGDGFNVSLSDDEGATWTEFEKFYGKGSSHKVNAIVAMSSLTHLKENGEFVDKWMGLFHDNSFRCYKTILTFDENGKMHWSDPQEFFKNSVNGSGKKIDQTFLAKMAKLCEIEVIRSEGGNGDALCLIARCETRRMNSMMSFSYDEGATWTELKEVPSALCGDRHKAEYLQDGRLFIVFRSIERDKAKIKANGGGLSHFISEGWVAWVGTFDDLVKWYNGDTTAEGEYRIKLAHAYNDGQTAPSVAANRDCGYSGLVILKDGTIVVSAYGRFSAESDKTYIISKHMNISDLDELYEMSI